MKDMFARHGIPESLIIDNMPFNGLKFKNFASEWEIDVVTSSPHYPKSNGLVERNVRTIKHPLKKADESKQDAFLALLEFRNSLSVAWRSSQQNCSWVGNWEQDFQVLSTYFNQCQSPHLRSASSCCPVNEVRKTSMTVVPRHYLNCIRAKQCEYRKGVSGNRLWFLNNMWPSFLYSCNLGWHSNA